MIGYEVLLYLFLIVGYKHYQLEIDHLIVLVVQFDRSLTVLSRVWKINKILA